MLVSPVERPVASAAYGFVRFIGGGLAPFVAGKMVDHWNIHVPFVVGAVAVVAGALVLATGHRMLAAPTPAWPPTRTPRATRQEIAGEVADEFGGAPAAIDSELPRRERLRTGPLTRRRGPRVPTVRDGDEGTTMTARDRTGCSPGRRRLADHAGPPGGRQRARPRHGPRARRRRPRPARAPPAPCCCSATARGSASAATSRSSPAPTTRARSSGSWHTTGTRSIRLLLTCPVPVLAGVHGAVAGAARGPARRLRRRRLRPLDEDPARPTARSASPPTAAPPGRSPGRSGAPRALELMLTNGTLTAADAHLFGLVGRLVEDDDLVTGRGRARARGRRRAGAGHGAHPRRWCAGRPPAPSTSSWTRRPG